MAKNPRHVLRSFKGVVPTTEPERITGLTGKKKQFLCGILGFHLYKVDGSYIRSQWADFLGGHPAVYNFIPGKEIWVDATIKEWLGYIASHEILEVLLMQLHDWKYERAHNAANSLEQELRIAGERGNLKASTIFEIWLAHLNRHFRNGRDTVSVAEAVARQLWKYV